MKLLRNWKVQFAGILFLAAAWKLLFLFMDVVPFDADEVVVGLYDMALIDFLRQIGLERGYTHYWVTYPLAFHSKEEILFVPFFPYKQDLSYNPRDDRYPLYGDLVESSQKIGFITARNQPLDDFLRLNLQRLGITWKEKKIGDYLVYYDFSRTVRPQELGLGVSSE
jgi:hypothetical protein